MRQKRIKGYWLKKSERYTSGAEAKARAAYLRSYEHISHVIRERTETGYVIKYSIAKWYVAELEKLNIKL